MTRRNFILAMGVGGLLGSIKLPSFPRLAHTAQAQPVSAHALRRVNLGGTWVLVQGQGRDFRVVGPV